MRVSPPIGALCVVAAAIAGTAWLAPPTSGARQVAVMLPAALYQELVERGRPLSGNETAARSVPQVIEALARQTAEPGPGKD